MKKYEKKLNRQKREREQAQKYSIVIDQELNKAFNRYKECYENRDDGGFDVWLDQLSARLI